MEEYIRLEEEKARRRGKIWDYEDVHDLGSIETEFLARVFNDTLTSEVALSCEPTVSSLNDEIDFRISFDESDDEDHTGHYKKDCPKLKNKNSRNQAGNGEARERVYAVEDVGQTHTSMLLR
nr:hypothetical protein [Tanacetum cinerariifolium]